MDLKDKLLLELQETIARKPWIDKKGDIYSIQALPFLVGKKHCFKAFKTIYWVFFISGGKRYELTGDYWEIWNLLKDSFESEVAKTIKKPDMPLMELYRMGRILNETINIRPTHTTSQMDLRGRLYQEV